jgi:sec-independent protein translocase protein TatC
MSRNKNIKPNSRTEHLHELRNRVIISLLAFICCFAVSYYFVENIYQFLVAPLEEIYKDRANSRLIYTGLTEAFFTYLKLAFYSGFFLAFPIIIMQVYNFIAPALFRSERKILTLFINLGPILFLAGGFICYQFIFPLAWKFFVGFENLGSNGGLPIILEARVSEYLSLSMQLILAFGLAFQIPIILLILIVSELIELETLKKSRKIAIVLIVVFAAIVTPPDIISQIGLAIAIYLLFEITLLIAKRLTKKKAKNA